MSNQEKYILVSLEEEKAKELANVISNTTSRKILDYLANKDEASESEISKELNLPLSTVHYNLQQLKKNSLVEIKHFSYSEKGKKIELYRVVKKFIVIAPKYAQKSFIKNILPLFFVSAAISLIIQFLTNLQSRGLSNIADVAQKAAYSQESAAIAQAVTSVSTNYYGYWFLLGSWSILIIYILVNLIKRK